MLACQQKDIVSINEVVFQTTQYTLATEPVFGLRLNRTVQ